MKALAAFILRGPNQAIMATVGAAMLAMMIPPLSMVSGAVVALATLRMGMRSGAIVVAGSTVFVATMAYFSLGSIVPGLVFFGVLWLPLWGLSWVLRETRSLALVTVSAGGLGIAAVLVTYMLQSDVVAMWEQILLTMFEPAMVAGGPLDDREAVVTILADVAQLMTGIIAAGMVLNTIICLFLARGMQAMLFNPGGFRSEFYELQLGPGMAIVSLAFIAISLLPLNTVSHMAGEIVIVVLSLYVIQGMAIIHAIADKRKLHVAWLVSLYLVMTVVLPQLMALVAVLGLMDTWVGFRRRVNI